MAEEEIVQSKTLDQHIEALEGLRQFSGPPGAFWPKFLEAAAGLVEAETTMLLLQEEAAWKSLCTWPAKGAQLTGTPGLPQKIEETAQAALSRHCAWGIAPKSAGRAGEEINILALQLVMADEQHVSVLVFLYNAAPGSTRDEVAARLRLVEDTPAIYQRWRDMALSKHEVRQFSEALDVMVLLNAEKRYVAVAMTLCNEIASRYRCSRVSLGWLERGGYVRLQAISHMEKFERKMDVVQTLEAAMEEAVDQDEEVVYPRPEGGTAVTRDHEAFAREQGVQFMVSLPLRLEEGPVGALTCERSEGFSEDDIRGLRVLCDQAVRRLGDLKENDRWFGARLAASCRQALAKLLGVEHTFAKAVGLIIFIALAFLLFGRLPYRVEGSFILKSDDVKYIPAPFDGYIDQVPVEIGDQVAKDELLLVLDTRELLLEESSALANLNRYTREAEKARAENSLAEMRIAQALADQAKAQLDVVRYHLDHAELRAPFQGIVVEGELEELHGAPVRKGDVLFKVAQLARMYAELEVDERDVQEVAAGMTGEMAFVSQPEDKFPVRVERIDPVAQTKEAGNVFLLRCELSEAAAPWWRPGMSGVAKIDVGWRNVLWIIAHRTVDFFRILLWW